MSGLITHRNSFLLFTKPYQTSMSFSLVIVVMLPKLTYITDFNGWESSHAMQLLSTSQRLFVLEGSIWDIVVLLLVDSNILVFKCAWSGPMVKTWGNWRRKWDNTGPSKSSKVLSMMARARSDSWVSKTIDFRGICALEVWFSRQELGRSRQRIKLSMPGILVMTRSMSSSPSTSLDSSTTN